MVILQVVGYKNSGKTTIAKELITYLASEGIRIASLKHHGHGGLPIGLEKTDSEQHKQAGAYVAGVLGEDVLQVSHSGDWQIQDILLIYQQLGVEFLLLEGFKKLTFPKLVLLKNEEELSLISSLQNVIGIITTAEINASAVPYPIFHFDETNSICTWVYHNYREGWL
ncbi:molybdopterin-guanine dinucleotide biosynthesis protein B [Ornithinibacillus sp. BX22]|uniref:Molybdopterin-guanine dinucleotide biosynthesis protein B n=2 Tax=Ornithinibacillus TaxID=484508 RepID=A0A923L6H8_9BACI|nr:MULTISPECIES: molybdopterin-guanine dinucleotide biosynthesis protein B [Ornithinibacillus]MBC5637407.1 molybdopterin-guanine dinucleotide biosynthesis protein B [Ornithinibacillus hominis]MBS3680285.1 molybdopterin-guanine dinucleotide biosynthesis protein B [Ornithinibacillus massiliensis]